MIDPHEEQDPHLQRARALLREIPLLDAHNDLPFVIRAAPEAAGDLRKFGMHRRLPTGDTDIPRLREGQVGAQIWAAFVPSDAEHPVRDTLEQIDLIRQFPLVHPETFAPALRAADIGDIARSGRIASMLAVEGCVGLENSLAPLRIWQAVGTRLVTLCHNGSLDWVDSATDRPRSGGLSEFGVAVVRELNRLGVIIDGSHVAPAALHRVLDVSDAPIVLSHSNAARLCPHPRNAPDDVLARIAEQDGLVMITFFAEFVSDAVMQWMLPVRPLIAGRFGPERLDIIREYERTHGPKPEATLAQVADHIEYIAARVGRRRVGIGSDFYGVPSAAQGLGDVTRFPFLLAEMYRRGWSDDDVAGLASGNFIRLFEAVERCARAG